MKLQVTVDRLEEEWAVLFLADTEHTVNWPLSLLPEGVSEGDILEVNMELDREATEKAREEAAQLFKELTKQP